MDGADRERELIAFAVGEILCGTKIVPFAVTAKLRRTATGWRVVGNLEYFENGGLSMLLRFTGSF
jgi:hypothetical protein